MTIQYNRITKEIVFKLDSKIRREYNKKHSQNYLNYEFTMKSIIFLRFLLRKSYENSNGGKYLLKPFNSNKQ